MYPSGTGPLKEGCPDILKNYQKHWFSKVGPNRLSGYRHQTAHNTVRAQNFDDSFSTTFSLYYYQNASTKKIAPAAS